MMANIARAKIPNRRAKSVDVENQDAQHFHIMLVEKYMQDYEITDKLAAEAIIGSVVLSIVEMVETYGVAHANGLGTFMSAVTKRAKVKLDDGTTVDLPLVKRLKFKTSKTLHKKLNDQCKNAIAALFRKKAKIKDKIDMAEAGKHVKRIHGQMGGLDGVV